MQTEFIDKLNQQFSTLSLAGRLAEIKKHFPNCVFTTSLGIEDQVITDTLATTAVEIDIVTLQTGRLFDETIDLLAKTRKRYSLDIIEFEPDAKDVQTYIQSFGANGFYDSIEARHTCCNIRKLAPLGKALTSRTGWITGLRRAQSQNRGAVPFVEWSSDYELVKFNPIADWELDDLNQAVAFNNIPVNALHKKGYPSIGCAPCTRAIKPGEPERAGRWWWEQGQSRECGLHVAQS